MKKTLIALVVFITASISVSGQVIVTSDRSVFNPYPKWRIAVHGGYSYRIGRTDPSASQFVTDYIKKLKHGYSYGAEVTWYFGNTFGLGLCYDDYHSARSEYVTGTSDEGDSRTGEMSDCIDIRFIGPIASYRAVSSGNKHYFMFNFGAGYLGYWDKSELFDSLVLRGDTFGYMAEFSYDYAITRKIAIGVSLSMISGYLTSYRKKENGGYVQKIDLEKGSYEGLVHLNVSAGIRFNL